MLPNRILIILMGVLLCGCQGSSSNSESAGSEMNSSGSGSEFPSEIVDFKPYSGNPLFAGTGTDTWDAKIRERGYIMQENDTYYMWYTGYYEDSDTLKLGYATSQDGLTWTRYQDNPVFGESWTEDMMVWKYENIYYMFAEGRNDIAHMLTSTDRVNWKDHGSLNIRQTNGGPLIEGPYGTPTVWRENGLWYLFYERNDQGIWLATSEDLREWSNVQDDPVIVMGPETYDQFGLAVNQIIKYNGLYYAYYHGTAYEDWREWTTNVAVSDDLIQWQKYENNPIMKENKSSGILVHDGEQYRLYTMHDEVAVHFHTFPEENSP